MGAIDIMNAKTVHTFPDIVVRGLLFEGASSLEANSCLLLFFAWRWCVSFSRDFSIVRGEEQGAVG